MFSSFPLSFPPTLQIRRTLSRYPFCQVDRGADLSWLSQYPHEREILFSPLMGQQALATRVHGGTLIVEMRLNLNMQSLTLEEVVSKRRKVVKDMVANVSADFERGLGEAWKTLGPSMLRQARTFLDALLGPLQSHEPEYYNEDAKLGGAIDDAVFLSSAVRGWADGLVALAGLCDRSAAELLSLETLDLHGKTLLPVVLDGLGMLLALAKLQKLTLKEAKSFGVTGAKRLAVELASAPHLVELECAVSASSSNPCEAVVLMRL